MSARHNAEDASINLTPMIDVVFLLVIFFMVGSKFSEAENRVEVDLPAAEMRAIARVPDERVVAVNASGEMTLDGTPLSVRQLTETLRQQHADYPGLQVAVRGDGDVLHQQMMDVFQAVRSSGVQQVSVSARRTQR